MNQMGFLFQRNGFQNTGYNKYPMLMECRNHRICISHSTSVMIFATAQRKQKRENKVK